jgi:maleate isomerase
MIGWRARLGIILPSLNGTTEAEFFRCLPDGVSAHFTRMEFSATTPEQYEGMLADVPSGARMLSHAHVTALMFACTSGSFYGGLGYDQKIISILQEQCGAPCSTTSTAAVNAFRTMGAKKIAMATPYPDWVNQKEKEFFEGSGYQVVNVAGLGLTGFDVCELHPETFYSFARRQDRPDADLIFLSCMGLRTLEILPRLEQDLGKPVLSSNQVTLWELLKLAGLPTDIITRDFGALFRIGRCQADIARVHIGRTEQPAA